MLKINELYNELANDYYEISPEQLQQCDWRELLLLDVRNPSEYQDACIHGSMNIPLIRLIVSAPYELDNLKVIVTYCHSGNRSSLAAKELRKLGFHALTLKGGIENWFRTNRK